MWPKVSMWRLTQTIWYYANTYTAIHHLMTGMCSEKHVIGWFCHCANIIECVYTNLHGIAYDTDSRLLQ